MTDADIAKVREALAYWPATGKDAAEAFDRIAARIKELEGALKPFADFADDENFAGSIYERRRDVAIVCSAVTGNALDRSDLDRARAALAQEKADG